MFHNVVLSRHIILLVSVIMVHLDLVYEVERGVAIS